MPGSRPGSRNTLTPRNVTYTRSTQSGVQTVNSTVHVAPERNPGDRHSNSRPLPEGHSFKKFTQPDEISKVKEFYRESYGPGSARFLYPEGTKFFGITGPDGKIKAAGELMKMNWVMSEVKHLTVAPSARGAGFGNKMLDHIESQTTTPMITATSKNPISIHMFESRGYNKAGVVQGPSGDNINVYTKNLKPADEG